MFKQPSFEDELFQGMQKNLVANKTEHQHGFSKIAKAIDLLNVAADIFDQAGMVSESQEITDILRGVMQDVK